jgi:hypothetical protein
VSSREHEQRQNVVAENEAPTLGGKHRRSTGEPTHEPCREDRCTRGETMKPITEVMLSWTSSIRSENFYPESETRRAMHQSDRPHTIPNARLALGRSGCQRVPFQSVSRSFR